jgi:acyl phosphate:glycerol-3-phosphate acyltransferase
MSLLISISFLVLPYLLGSIATAVWVSRYGYGIDIRTQGSNNAGSTNMFRMLGLRAGVITQIVDIGKGALASCLPLIVRAAFPGIGHWLSDWSIEMQQLACGLLCVIGHIYPVFAGFKGGKGINTLLGMMLVTNFFAALVCLLFFVLILYLSRYVAVASMAAVSTYPLYLLICSLVAGRVLDVPHLLLGVGMALLVVFTHRSNLSRLWAGTESRNRWFEGKVKGESLP